jgi:NAD(P)-dependent dehydrogenase (short-subunit alcohol dehydrogenase family)
MLSLDGRRALITGASRGVGFEIAKTFSAAGAEIVATARNEQRLDKLRREIEAAGGKITIVPGDLSTRAGAREVARRSGDVDVLINNAAFTGVKWQSFLVTDDASWDFEFAVNLRRSGHAHAIAHAGDGAAAPRRGDQHFLDRRAST